MAGPRHTVSRFVLVYPTTLRPMCVRHAGTETPLIPPTVFPGRTWWTASSSKEAEKDILILETNGNSSVVETHRPTYYCNRHAFSSDVCEFRMEDIRDSEAGASLCTSCTPVRVHTCIRLVLDPIRAVSCEITRCRGRCTLI